MACEQGCALARGVAGNLAGIAAISHSVARTIPADAGAAWALAISAAEVAFADLADFVAGMLAGVAGRVDVTGYFTG